MRQTKIIPLLLAAIITAGCANNAAREQSAKAEAQIEAAYKQKDYNRIMLLADSLRQLGQLSDAKAYYWQGYASDRTNKKRMAEFYWKASLDAAANSRGTDDIDAYTKSACRLANLLAVRGDYENALKSAIPAAERIEKLKCDTTSDYVNLLIYIGCCQAGIGIADQSADDGFDRAYQKHIDNIDKNHTDEAYKNAIAGLINIAYACNETKNYKEALSWTEKFGKLLGEYEQRPGTSSEYIDKQIGRFDIYQAIALLGLGQTEEADTVFARFKTTQFSQTPEGRINANEYLFAANRWDEAADNYRSLDALLSQESPAYSLDNIESMVLKKYRANLLAGRRDSAIAVSMMISDSLENALNRQKQVNAEEQVIIVDEVEKMTARQADEAREDQQKLLGLLAAVVMLFIGVFALNRRANRQMRIDHAELQEAYHHLEKQTAANERLETERKITQDVQQRMLPESMPVRKEIEISASLTPGKGISSDLYDALIRDEKLFFCISNAADGSVSSAVLTGAASALFRTVSMHESAPEKIVATINETIAREHEEASVKLFVGVLDLATWKLAYCNAGHNVPLLLDSDVNQLESDANVPIGNNPHWDFTAQETAFEKGTMLFLYTDGALKAENDDRKQFGDKRMRGAALQGMKMHATAKPFIGSILAAIEKHTGDSLQDCDMTLLVVRRV